ncbi:universal stress protein [Nafulsella turpanensis]|uniref:universal stress protein n=1 Tax=Nafulsella turpanensis TaxID=1265690 RepID=UPI00034B88AF|nr:universal stress protein [Nafulsella turpanensis]
MKEILDPTDYSELSGYALTLAHKFTRQSGAEIFALKVTQTAADALFTKDGQLIDSGDYDMESIRKDMDESKTAIEGWAEKYQIPVKTVVRTGKLTEQVLHCIKKEQPDLVVMGTHGLHGLRELIADSVTEQLVRESSVPVLSLKCDRSDLEIKNIVLASRFEKASSR